MSPKTKIQRRPIEREYLAVLNSVVRLDTWQAICQRAVNDALEGDAKARDWLAKWLMGLESRLLTVLAAEESGGEPTLAAESEIKAQQQRIENARKQAERDKLLSDVLFP